MNSLLRLLVGILPSICLAAAPASVTDLIAHYQQEPVFWKQVEMTDAIVQMSTPGDLAPLEPWLAHPDRHIRANVGYLFARMGDPRGFDTIVAILGDRSADRVISVDHGNFPQPGAKATPAVLAAQIREDRHYAVHLLGDLHDARALGVLIPLLDHDDVKYKVAWALGEIGDAHAITPLIAGLRNPDPMVRTSAIHALVRLRATLALPAIEALVNDETYPTAGDYVTVGDTAKEAADTLRPR